MSSPAKENDAPSTKKEEERKEVKEKVCCFFPLRSCAYILLLLLMPILILAMYSAFYDPQYIYVIIAYGVPGYHMNQTNVVNKTAPIGGVEKSFLRVERISKNEARDESGSEKKESKYKEEEEKQPEEINHRNAMHNSNRQAVNGITNNNNNEDSNKKFDQHNALMEALSELNYFNRNHQTKTNS